MTKKYLGYTHKIPMVFLKLWKILFCRIGWHAWDEVLSEDHYFFCDACQKTVLIKDFHIMCDCKKCKESLDEFFEVNK